MCFFELGKTKLVKTGPYGFLVDSYFEGEDQARAWYVATVV